MRRSRWATSSVALLGLAVAVVTNLVTNTIQVDAAWWAPALWIVFGVLVLVSVVPALVRPDEPADLPKVLARLRSEVGLEWRHEAVRVLGLDHPAPMPVHWNLTAEPRITAGEQGTALGGEVTWRGTSLDIGELARRFRALPRRRMVILGGPGAGKTTLAIQLLRQLMEEPADGTPVPVLLRIADWDPTRPEDFEDWLGDRLLRGYPWLGTSGPGVARSLFAQELILPVLDGLDEAPQALQPVILARINRAMAAGNQIVLSCRTADYLRAAGAGEALAGAAVVEPLPLTAAAAADHLQLLGANRPAGGGWQGVIAELRTDRATPMRHALATPLGLWLLRSTYDEAGLDPAPLLDRERFPDAAAVRAHLFDRLIPLRLAAHVKARGRHATELRLRRYDYDPDRVTHWLGYLADLMDRTPNGINRAGTSSVGIRDLAWWRLAALTRRRPPPGPGTIGALLAFSLLWTVAVGVLAFGLGILPALLAGAFLLLIDYREANNERGSWAQQEPGRANLRFATKRWKLRAGIGIALMAMGSQTITLAVLFGIIYWTSGLTAAVLLLSAFLATLCFTMLLDILVRWAEEPPEGGGASTPVRSWRDDRGLHAFRAGVGAVAGGVVCAVVHLVVANPPLVVVASVAGSALAGAFFGLVGGRHHAWIAYRQALTGLAWRGRLPSRLMDFLDDAHKLGLLRATGPVYQFRHADFQDHLAARFRGQEPAAPAVPAVPAIPAPPSAGDGPPADGRTTRIPPEPAGTVPAPRDVTDIVVNGGDGTLAATNGVQLMVLDPATGARRMIRGRGLPGGLIVRLEQPWEATGTIAFSPDGRRLAWGGSLFGSTRRVRVLDTGAWRIAATAGAQRSATPAIAFSPDGRRLAVTADGVTRIWDLATGTAALELSHPGGVGALAFSADGRRLATGGQTFTATYRFPTMVWDATTGLGLAEIESSSTPVTGLGFTADGAHLLVGARERVFLADAATGERCWSVATVRTHFPRDTIRWGRMALSPAAGLLVTSDGDRTMHLRDLRTGAVLDERGLDHDILALALSPDGTVLAAATADDRISHWNLVR